MLVSGSTVPGSNPGRGHCVEFLGKILYSDGASLHLGVEMGTGELNAGGNPSMDYHPIQGGVKILLVTSCYRNRDGPLGLYADSIELLPVEEVRPNVFEPSPSKPLA